MDQIMLANELVELYGTTLINRWILTEAIGSYLGGIAQIIALTPDENASEIPIQVNHPICGKIGIFEHETVILLEDSILEKQEENHEGMIYNPVSKTWSWF
jgi:hypothetical protein